MTAVLVTGATGLLGHALTAHLASRPYRVLRQGRGPATEFSGDLGDAGFVARMMEESAPDVVINLVALTDVDRCERHPAEAFAANVRTAENLARLVATRTNTRMIQISTDQVYDGPGPHIEANVAPCNIYAYSKYCAELSALSTGATVLRTNFFGPGLPARKSFSDWLIDGFTREASLRLVTDVFFSPLHLDTLVRMIEKVVSSPMPGVFNLGSRGGMSKRDFAHELAQQLGFDTRNATDATSAELGLHARRPGDMRMDVRSFEQTFNVRLPELKTEISLLERTA